MFWDVSEAQRHQPAAIAESHTSCGISLRKRDSIRTPATKSTITTPSNACRIVARCASEVSGDFQNAASARSNSILILCRWSDVTPGTGQSSTHLMAFSSAVRGGLGPLYGAKAAGVSAQPPPSAAPSSALLTIAGSLNQ